MKRILVVSLVLVSVICSSQSINTKKVFKDAEKQARISQVVYGEKNDITFVSPRTIENGELKLVSSRDWTSGFYPGIWWFLYNNRHYRIWLNNARLTTAHIEKEKTNGGTHDMG